jgi:hypothetical protein
MTTAPTPTAVATLSPHCNTKDFPDPSSPLARGEIQPIVAFSNLKTPQPLAPVQTPSLRLDEDLKEFLTSTPLRLSRNNHQTTPKLRV